MIFNASRNVIFLVVGKAKARMPQIALSDHYDPENIPVQRIKPAQGYIIWHVDSAAAKLIRERS
jgi:6-phosphogluconolactonase